MIGGPMLLSIDDGHSETKVVFEEPGTGRRHAFVFASKAQRGVNTLNTEHGEMPPYYLCGTGPHDIHTNDRFTVHPRRSSVKVDNRYSDYPLSMQNRVIVRHAILAAMGRCDAEAPEEVWITTTLPHRDYYGHDNRPKEGFIERKKANLGQGVWLADPRTGEGIAMRPRIGLHKVFPEGMMAFYDRLFEFSESGAVMSNGDIADRFKSANGGEVIIIDVGGKTTDVIRGRWNGVIGSGIEIDASASDSIQIGAGRVTDALTADLGHRFDVYDIGDADAVLRDRTWSYQGEPVDVGEEVARAVYQVSGLLIDELRPRIDRHETAQAVILCGGGIELMPRVGELFGDRQRMISHNPQFANARGILKIVKRQGGLNGRTN